MSRNVDPADARGNQPPLKFERSKVREFFRLLGLRKWRILGVTALICAAAGAILSQLPKEYRATSLLLFEFRKNAASVDSTAEVPRDVSTLQTEIETLRSTYMLGLVVDDLRLNDDLEPATLYEGLWEGIVSIYRSLAGEAASKSVKENSYDQSRALAVAALARNIRVSSRAGSTMVEISVDSVDAAKSKRIADKVVELYLGEKLRARLDTDKRRATWFNEHVEELKDNVRAAESAEAAFREKANLTSSAESAIASLPRANLDAQLLKARSMRADKEARLLALQQAARDPAKINVLPEILTDPLIASLRGQEAEVLRRITDLEQRYGVSHPRMVQVYAEQKQIQGQIAAQVAKIIASVQSDLDAAKAKVLELLNDIDQLNEKTGRSGKYQIEIRQLERGVQASRTEYEEFSKRSKEGALQNDRKEPAVRILSTATVLPDAVYPKYEMTMILALVGGAFFSMVLVGIMESLDAGLRSGEHIERLTGRGVIGMIPALSRSIKAKFLPAKFVVDKPTSAYAEAIRSAFTAMILGATEKTPKVIMITSSVPSEGKSTFASSMASLVARSNPEKKVILVDCDLRRPSVCKSLGVLKPVGTVNEYLLGEKKLEEVMARVESTGLYYVPAKNDTPNSAEVLGSKAMQDFVLGLSREFDFVFLDTPPLMAVTDARVAAEMSDYVIFLVKWEKTRRELVTNALKLLQNIRAEVGVVLSQVDVRRHARYGYGDYGYSYSKYRNYYTS